MFDILGRHIATLVDGAHPPGMYTVRFDSEHLPGGTYIVRFESAGRSATHKLLLLK